MRHLPEWDTLFETLDKDPSAHLKYGPHPPTPQDLDGRVWLVHGLLRFRQREGVLSLISMLANNLWRDVTIEPGVRQRSPDRVAATPELHAVMREVYAISSLVVERYPRHEVGSARKSAALILLEGRDDAGLRLLRAALAAVVATKGLEDEASVIGAGEDADWATPIRAVVALATTPLDAAREYVAPGETRTALGRRRAREVLAEAWQHRGHDPASAEGWAELLVSLWGGPMTEFAQQALRELPESITLPRLRARIGPPRVARVAPPAPRWLERYREGEHERVWQEMDELGETAFETPEVLAVANETMGRVLAEIARIGAVLTKGKYRFAQKKNWHRPPDDATAEQIAKAEKALKVRLPVALRSFLEIVGSVDLSERYPDEEHCSDYEELTDAEADARGSFAGLGRFDPLQVIRLKDIVQVTKLQSPPPTKGMLAGPPELQPARSVVFGVSPSCKSDPEVDPEPYYRAELRFYGADSPVLDGSGGPPIAFVDYLRQTLLGGGFRKLAARTGTRDARQLAELRDRSKISR